MYFGWDVAELDTMPRRRFARPAEEAPLGVALVGYGYWGPNLARNVAESPEMRLHALCERDAQRGAAFAQRFPGVPVHEDFDVVLADPNVDAVLVATPPATHHGLVKRALLAGKHVLVEKPLATTTADAVELVDLAEREDLVLMPGHTFVYSPAVNTVRQLLTEGVIGEVYFVTSARMNLGKYQRDGVVTDLAPHDLSILMYWLNEPVVQVTTSGCTVFQEGVPETAFMTLTFASGKRATVQVSWLAPRKVRQMVVVGSRRMVQYDDTASDEPIRIYDRGMDMDFGGAPQNFGEYQLTYRSGEVLIPRIEAAEPLALELADFANSIRTGATPRSNAKLGLEIVSVIEAAETSLRRNGEPISLQPIEAARIAA
jgi:predicted dehydrogenase